ncbi:MAG: hypothetical protein DMF98_22475, partial [Acidobacteria bacterium]
MHQNALLSQSANDTVKQSGPSRSNEKVAKDAKKKVTMHSAYLEGRSLTTDTSGAARPDALGPFRVLHQIGAGTFGPVFHAYDQQRDRLVAVKVFTL